MLLSRLFKTVFSKHQRNVHLKKMRADNHLQVFMPRIWKYTMHCYWGKLQMTIAESPALAKGCDEGLHLKQDSEVIENVE